MKRSIILLFTLLLLVPLAFAYGDISAGPVDVDDSRVAGNFYQSCSGNGWGHSNGAYTNSHNTITIRVYVPTAKSNAYLIFYGDFDYGQLKESMTATVNGVSRTFNEPGDYGGWHEFTVGPFNLNAGNNDIVMKGAYWHDSQDCPSSQASGSIHFSNGGWVKLQQNNCVGPDGAAITSGSSRTYYLTSTVPYGQSCSAQTRTCNNGVLSGSYTYSSCSVQTGNSCTGPDGSVIAHGSSRTYYLTSNPPFGQSCYSQTRTCNNGVLSGTYTAGTCTIQNPNSCTGPDGSIIAHGTSHTYYSTSTVSGGQTCVSENRSCNNGYLSGSFVYATCSVQPNSCVGPDGVVIASGYSRTYYQTGSVGYGQTCNAQTRTCTNGVLSGTFTFSSCSPINALDCTGPDGSAILHGQSRNYYLAYSVPYGQTCTVEARSCNNGVLSGSYTAAFCTVGNPNSCTGPDGAIIPHGSSRVYYYTSSASVCTNETRTCNNGALSGSFQFASCMPPIDVQPPVVDIQSPVSITYSVNYVSLNYTAFDAQGVSACWVYIDSVYHGTLPLCMNATIIGLSQGAHTVTVYANDTSGNVASDTVTFTISTMPVDNQVPVVSIQNPQNTTYTSTSLPLRFTAFDNVAVQSCWYTINGGGSIALPSCQNITLPTFMLTGTYTLRVYANDAAGNIGSALVTFTIISAPQCYLNTDCGMPSTVYGSCSGSLRNITVITPTCSYGGCVNITTSSFVYDSSCTPIDAQPPVVDIQSPTNSTYATSTVQLSYTAFDNVAIDRCWFTVDTVPFIPFTNCGNMTIAGLVLGGHTIVVYANDTSGNVASDTVSFTVIAPPINDTQAPVVTIYSPLNTTYNQSTVPLNYVATDNVAVTNCWYTVNGGPVINLGLSNISLSNTNGTFVIIVSCQDAAGNIGSATVTYTNVFNWYTHQFTDGVKTPIDERQITVLNFDTVHDGDFRYGDTKMYLRFKNTGDQDLTDLTVTISIPELNAWTKLGPFRDFESGETIDRIALLDLEDAQPGYYYARLSFTSKEYTKAIWYEVKVE